LIALEVGGGSKTFGGCCLKPLSSNTIPPTFHGAEEVDETLHPFIDEFISVSNYAGILPREEPPPAKDFVEHDSLVNRTLSDLRELDRFLSLLPSLSFSNFPRRRHDRCTHLADNAEAFSLRQSCQEMEDKPCRIRRGLINFELLQLKNVLAHAHASNL